MSNKLLAAYEQDTTAVNEGAWAELRSGIRVKIRSEHSVEVREVARKLDRKYRALILADGMPADKQDERDTELCATAILVDWDTDCREAFGEPTTANIRKACTELPAFRRDVIYLSRLDETFRTEEVRLMAGNSAAPSVTTVASKD
jgi:hypothetical protein